MSFDESFFMLLKKVPLSRKSRLVLFLVCLSDDLCLIFNGVDRFQNDVWLLFKSSKANCRCHYIMRPLPLKVAKEEFIMTKLKKDLPLLVFTSKKDDHKAVYMVFGKFKKKKMDKKLDLYYPEFYDVTVFTGDLSSVSNVNRMVSCDKTIQISNAYEARRACAGYTQDNQDYHFIRINNDLKELLDTISKKCINIYGFPLNVLTPNMNMVELLLVTNKYAIYSSDNEYMVMDAHSHQVLKNCVVSGRCMTMKLFLGI